MGITVSIIGGCGHVGLPLGITLAEASNKVFLIDINENAVNLVNDGVLPFHEADNAEEIFKRNIQNGNLKATLDKDIIKRSDVVVFVTGTPVDEHLNPRVHDVTSVVEQYLDVLSKDQLIILRSTVYPGVVEIIYNILTEKLGGAKIAFCPERIAQGFGLREIYNLPQIISGTSEEAELEAIKLFENIAPKTIVLSPMEAELAKLMTNSWRYLEFAIANQFYVMAESRGLDFYKIFDTLKNDYPRAQHFASPGFAAGPCLFKDTMQLSSFHKGNFFLGHSAMLVNEGLPSFLIDQLEKKIGSIKGKKIAILGMTFKANNDDIRESLSYKLKKELEIKMAKVIPSDVFLDDMVDYDLAIDQADAVILGVPHRQYLDLEIKKPYVDCWGVWRRRFNQ